MHTHTLINIKPLFSLPKAFNITRVDVRAAGSHGSYIVHKPTSNLSNLLLFNYQMKEEQYEQNEHGLCRTNKQTGSQKDL